jgi:catechol 2,3-dioxygenase-like lactoylglutathione lyase family enzyme
MPTYELTDATALLQVFDMRTSIAFYCTMLGFEIVKKSHPGDEFDWAWLRRHQSNIMLNSAYEEEHRPANPDPARIAAHQDTTIFFGCPDVDLAYAELRAAGLDVPAPRVAPYGMKQLSFADPDGYGLCFQWQHSTAANVL